MKKQILLLLATFFITPLMYFNTIKLVTENNLEIPESRIIYFISGMLTVTLISLFYKKT